MEINGLNAPILPEHYAFCELQIAGHHYTKQKEEQFGVLLNTKNGYLLKPLQKPPRGDTEQRFYEYVFGTGAVSDKHSLCNEEDSDNITASLIELRKFIPSYYGVIDLQVDHLGAKFLQLENVNARFRKPCVVDVKIGAKTWDPAASKEKIAVELVKYPWATLLGFRFLGMKIFKSHGNYYESLDSKWGKTVPDTEVVTALGMFFQRDLLPHCRVLAVCVVVKLKEILNFFERQRCFQFYSSSILISYDGVVNDELNSIDFSTVFDNRSNNDDVIIDRFIDLVDIHMIDFTHVFYETNVKDENYLHGLRNFIIYLEKFIDSLR